MVLKASSPQLLPPSPNTADPPSFHRMNCEVFEAMCCALLAKEAGITRADLFGRPRELQFGIDVLGELEPAEGLTVVSCKCRVRINRGELYQWSTDFLKHWDTYWQARQVRRFILAIASDTKSFARRNEIESEKARFLAVGIVYEAWSPRILQEKLRPHPELIAQFLGPEWVSRLCGATAPSVPSADLPVEEIPIDIQAELDRGDTLDGECKFAEAAAVYENAVRLAGSAGNKRALIKARIELGEALTRDETNLEKAKKVLDACLTDLKTRPDPKSRSTVLHLLGHIALCQGAIHEGKALCREALTSSRERGDRFQEGLFLIAVAHAEEMSGNLATAHHLLDEAAVIFRVEYREAEGWEKVRAGTNLAGAFAMKALVYEHEGQAEEVLASLTEAERLFRLTNHPENLARTLATKCRALFGKSKWEEGVQVLEEAEDIFKRLGNVHWLLKCYDVRARLAFQMDNQRLALAVCMGAVEMARAQGTPEDHVHALGQMSALCHRNEMDEPVTAFHREAKHVAAQHNLTDLQVDLLLDEANLRRGNDMRREDDEDGKRLVSEALAHLEALLVKCEVKGRRAHYMGRISKLHTRLRHLTEARSWSEQALRNFDEIGDAGGVADALGMLAAIAREDKDKVSAIRLLESLLERSKGKLLYHFQAGAHHDLASLKMSQGDIVVARKNLDLAASICAGHPMPDVEEAIRETQARLELAERSRGLARDDLPTMLRQLHAWKERYPQDAEAILSFWYHSFSAELWSNIRSQVGIKFLVYADSANQFGRFVDSWSALGDLFIYGASFPLKAERGIDIFPWLKELVIPTSMQFVGIKGNTTLSEEKSAQALIMALHEVPYFLTLLNGKIPAYSDDKVFVVGRRYRLHSDIAGIMLSGSADDVIDRRVLAMPVHFRGEDRPLIDNMCVAWENHLIPVFFGRLPTDRDTSLERIACLPLPRMEPAKRDCPAVAAAAVYWGLRRFMAEVGGNSDIALMHLAEAFGDDLANGASHVVTASLHIVGFRAGPTRVSHPALVLAD